MNGPNPKNKAKRLSAAALTLICCSYTITAYSQSVTTTPSVHSNHLTQQSTATNQQTFLTSANELIAIRSSALQDQQPQKQNIETLTNIANDPWPYGDVNTEFGVVRTGAGIYDKHCVKIDDTSTRGILPYAGGHMYSRILAFALTGNTTLAEQARQLVLQFAQSSGYNKTEGTVSYTGANQCALELSWFVPLYIESAMLLEMYPGWSVADKQSVQSWLANHAYKVTSAISNTRRNNWGTAAAFASWAIAHYLDDSSLMLNEVYPTQRSFTPDAARQEHLDSQLRRLGNTWAGDSRCTEFGPQYHGGFPNELRRGSTGCDGTFLQEMDASYAYQITTASHLIFHAEALRRVGQNELYALQSTGDLPVIHNAIAFVINNSYGQSFDWKKSDMGVLRVANSYYSDPRVCDQIADSTFFREGRYLPFAKVLHPIDCPSNECNLLPNGDFESGADGWFASTQITITSDAAEGSSALAVDAGSLSTRFPVQSGADYQFTGRYKSSGASDWSGYGFDYLDASGVELAESFQKFPVSSDYVDIALSGTVPVGTASMRLWVYTPAGRTTVLDNLKVHSTACLD